MNAKQIAAALDAMEMESGERAETTKRPATVVVGINGRVVVTVSSATRHTIERTWTVDGARMLRSQVEQSLKAKGMK